MSLSARIIACLRERVANHSDGKPVFETAEDHRLWIWGEGESSPGLLRDPKGALARMIRNSRGDVVHPGVQLEATDEVDLLQRIKSLLTPSIPAMAGMVPERGSNVAATCPDLSDPHCWY